MSAQPKEVAEFLRKIADSDAHSVLVIRTDRATNTMTMEMIGYQHRDIPALSAYSRFRMDSLLRTYFNAQVPGQRPAPPLMQAPQRSDQVVKKDVAAPKVRAAVRTAIRASKKKKR